VSNGVTYLSERFYAANPKVVKAVYDGVVRANALINRDPKEAARIYLEVSGEKTPPAEIEAIITLPGTVYDVAPHGVLAVAKFLNRTGFLPAAPNGWKELFLPFVHGEDGS
jgi:NitT/TauT family transport system substrate-binding protein